MLESLELPSMAIFQRIYQEGLSDLLARGEFKREPAWTEALAVGDQVFVERVAKKIGSRQRFTYSNLDPSIPGAMCVREKRSDYTSNKG